MKKFKFKFEKGLHILNQHLNAILTSILPSDCKQTIWMIIQRELVIQITLIFFIGWSEMPFSAMENLKNYDHEREDYRDRDLKRSDLISRNHEKIENLLEPIHALKIDSPSCTLPIDSQREPTYTLPIDPGIEPVHDITNDIAGNKKAPRGRKNKTSDAFQAIKVKISSVNSLKVHEDIAGNKKSTIPNDIAGNKKSTRVRKNKTSDAFQASKVKISSVNSLSSRSNSDYFSSSDYGSQHTSSVTSNYNSPVTSNYNISSNDDFLSNSSLHIKSTFNGSPLRTKPTILESELSVMDLNEQRLDNEIGEQKVNVMGGQKVNVVDEQEENFELNLDSLDPRISILSSMSIFTERPDFLSKIKPFLEFKVYERGNIVQRQGDIIKNIYWILDGNCTVSQEVSFLQTIVDGQWIIKSEYVNITPSSNEEKTTLKNIDCQNLDAGSWFAYLPGIEPNSPLTKKKCIEICRSHVCDCSVTADTRIIVAQIPFEVLVDLASISLLYNLHRQTSIYRFKHEFLREEYLAQNNIDKLRTRFSITFSESISLV